MNLNHQKIEETLNSLTGIQKASADPFIYDKVIARMAAKKVNEGGFVISWRWSLAGLSLLLVLNTFTFFSSGSSTSENNSGQIGTFATEYFGSGNSYNY